MVKISEFIARLTELQEVAGDDVEVAVGHTDVRYEPAMCELANVVPTGPDEWRSLDNGNTHQIVTIC